MQVKRVILSVDQRCYAFFDQLAKFREQRSGIVRSGRGFRMILHAKNRLRFVPHAFHRLVVEIDAVHCHVGRQRFRIDREAMILGSDFDFAGFKIFDRLIAAAMAEFQFESFSAKSLSQNLVAQANAENRECRFDQIATRSCTA